MTNPTVRPIGTPRLCGQSGQGEAKMVLFENRNGAYFGT